ncbi:MAG: FecR domain-containing protein, partial [Pseudolabrys sp.]
MAIGKIKNAIGAVSIVRTNASAAAAGDLLYQDDVIETGDDGHADVLFVDGTKFHLYANSQLVLDQFIFGTDNLPDSARLRVAKGKFGLLAGKLAAAGRFTIETPLGRIQNVLPV